MLNFSEAGGASVISISGYGVRTHVRPRFVRLFAVAALLFCAVHAYAVRPTLTAAKTPAFSYATAANKIAANTTQTPTPVPASVAAPGAPAQIASMVSCTAASYALPAQLDLTGASAGLTQIVDTPEHYEIYGSSGNEISQQISKCAPHTANVSGTYAAYTSYSITWQYNYNDDGTGVCTLSSAKIGLHQNQIFPQWQAAGSTSLQAQWQSFMSGLTTHEQGHLNLNEQYAEAMLAELQNFPATSCSAITCAVNAQMNRDLAALNAAHQTYENQTDYGAAQGALVP